MAVGKSDSARFIGFEIDHFVVGWSFPTFDELREMHRDIEFFFDCENLHSRCAIGGFG